MSEQVVHGNWTKMLPFHKTITESDMSTDTSCSREPSYLKLGNQKRVKDWKHPISSTGARQPDIKKFPQTKKYATSKVKQPTAQKPLRRSHLYSTIFCLVRSNPFNIMNKILTNYVLVGIIFTFLYLLVKSNDKLDFQ